MEQQEVLPGNLGPATFVLGLGVTVKGFWVISQAGRGMTPTLGMYRAGGY